MYLHSNGYTLAGMYMYLHSNGYILAGMYLHNNGYALAGMYLHSNGYTLADIRITFMDIHWQVDVSYSCIYTLAGIRILTISPPTLSPPLPPPNRTIFSLRKTDRRRNHTVAYTISNNAKAAI